MRLVVEFEGVVGVGEVLLGLSLDLRVGLNPVEKFGVVVGVFGVSRLISLESPVVALFFLKGSFIAPAKSSRKIIATDEGRGVQHRPTNHDHDTGHFAYMLGMIFQKGFTLDGAWKDFLVLEVLA